MSFPWHLIRMDDFYLVRVNGESTIVKNKLASQRLFRKQENQCMRLARWQNLEERFNKEKGKKLSLR